jgi:exonuclease III
MQVPESLVVQVHDVYHLPEMTGSDHCPVGLVLRMDAALDA